MLRVSMVTETYLQEINGVGDDSLIKNIVVRGTQCLVILMEVGDVREREDRLLSLKMLAAGYVELQISWPCSLL